MNFSVFFFFLFNVSKYYISINKNIYVKINLLEDFCNFRLNFIFWILDPTINSKCWIKSSVEYLYG